MVSAKQITPSSGGIVTTWKPVPDGTRVEHLQKGYQGWVDGLTSLPTLHDGPKHNPDGHSQYRIRLCEEGNRAFRFAPEESLKIYSNLEDTFVDTSPLKKKELDKRQFKGLLLPGMVWYLDRYHARPDLTRSLQDPLSRLNTGMITSLKHNGSHAIDHFLGILDPLVRKDVSIAFVPSHDPNSFIFGLQVLSQKLAQRGRIDATCCLQRHTYIYPSHGDPERRWLPDRHLNSINVKNGSLVIGKLVLLLDDIVTTGTSLLSCRTLLLQAGAAEVVCLALGNSVQ